MLGTYCKPPGRSSVSSDPSLIWRMCGRLDPEWTLPGRWALALLCAELSTMDGRLPRLGGCSLISVITVV